MENIVFAAVEGELGLRLGLRKSRKMESELQLYPAILLVLVGCVCTIALAFVPWLKLCKAFLSFSVLSSILMTAMFEYLSIQAENKIMIANAPRECFMDLDQQHGFMYFWLNIKLFFNNLTGDYCHKYRSAILMQPYAIYKATLLKAISITFTEFFFVPLGRLGTAFNDFFSNAFSGTSILLLVPKFLLLVIIIVVCLLAMAIAFNGLPGFGHRFISAAGNYMPYNSQGNAMRQPQPIQAVGYREHYPRSSCCYHCKHNAVEDLPPTGLYRPIHPHPAVDGRICYQATGLSAKDLQEHPKAPKNEDPGSNLLFIEEKLSILVKFAYNNGSGEEISSVADVLKEALKDLQHLGVENFGIAYKHVSAKIDIISDCTESLASFYACHETTMEPVIILTEMKDSIQKLHESPEVESLGSSSYK